MIEITEVWKQPENCFECEMFMEFKYTDGVFRYETQDPGFPTNTVKHEIYDYSNYVGRCGVFGHLCDKRMCDIKQLRSKKSFSDEYQICKYKWK